MIPKEALSQPGWFLSFEQKDEDDINPLAERCLNSAANFTPEFRRQQRHAGYDFLHIPEETVTEGEDESSGISQGYQSAWDQSLKTVYGQSHEIGDTEEKSQSNHASIKAKRSEQDQQTSQSKHGYTFRGSEKQGTEVASREDIEGSTKTKGIDREQGQTESEGRKSHRRNGTKSGIEIGTNEKNGQSLTLSQQATKRHSVARTTKTHIVSKYEDEYYQSGLKTPLDVQRQGFRTGIYRLAMGQFIAFILNYPVIVAKSHFIQPPKPTREQVIAYIEQLDQTPYLITPSQEPEKLPEPKKQKRRGAAARLNEPPTEEGS